MKISDQLIEDIRTQANIVDVIGDYISLEKKGRNYFACCPFHQEDTPSFSVSEEKQLFYCFGCHEGGNIFNFPMKYEGLSFQESVLHVAEYTNVDLSQIQTSTTIAKVSTNQEYYELMKFVSEFYEYLLQTDKGKIAKNYLQERGISQKEIEDFHIGFAPNEHLLAKLLEEKGYSLEKARELGLIFESKDMTQYYDAFRGRVVFPITDSYGNIIGFSGRILPMYESKQTSKYFHSPETKVFKKRETLYNLSFVKTAIKKEKLVYLCEGIFDVIALAKAGITNAVCTLGTALTIEQIQLLKKLNSLVVFCFDNDNAGKTGMLKAFELAAQYKLKSEAVIFWEYSEKDLDEFIESFDAARLKQLVQQRVDRFEYYLKYYQDTLNLDNNDDRQEFVKKTVAILQYSNLATKEFYYNKIKEITGYSDRALQDFITRDTNESRINEIPPTQEYYFDQLSEPLLNQRIAKKIKLNKQDRCELLILKGLCNDVAFIRAYQNKSILSKNLIFRKIVYEILEEYRIKGRVDVSSLIGKLDPEEAKILSQAIYLDEPITIEVFNELLETLKVETEKEYLKDVAIRGNVNDQQKKIDNIQQYLEFKKKANRN